MEDLQLSSRWSWYAHVAFQGTYKQSYLKIYDFDTIQMFWRLWNNIPTVARIFSGKEIGLIEGQTIAGYSIFQQGVLPEWEDLTNASGGEWWVRHSMGSSCIEDMWKDLCMALVGNRLERVVGIRLIYKSASRGKANFKIEAWFSKEVNQDPVMQQEVLASLKQVLACPDLQFTYGTHADANETRRKPTLERNRTHQSRVHRGRGM